MSKPIGPQDAVSAPDVQTSGPRVRRRKRGRRHPRHPLAEARHAGEEGGLTRPTAKPGSVIDGRDPALGAQRTNEPGRGHMRATTRAAGSAWEGTRPCPSKRRLRCRDIGRSLPRSLRAMPAPSTGCFKHRGRSRAGFRPAQLRNGSLFHMLASEASERRREPHTRACRASGEGKSCDS